MPSLFPWEDLNEATEGTLSAVYERACDTLLNQHHLNSEQLSGLVDVMTNALLVLHSFGIRDEAKLARNAVARALMALRYQNGTASAFGKALPRADVAAKRPRKRKGASATRRS
jgi:hypothetical protein